MSVLFLRISAPMQSWGSKSRFSRRDTCMEPTKSGILGMICSAMGKPRAEGRVEKKTYPSLAELAVLGMAVRADREGRMLRDFQTTGGGDFLDDRYGVVRADGTGGAEVVSGRYYLSDALFLVALHGERDLLERIDRALRNPVWPIYFGRKSFVPAAPVSLEGGLIDDLSLENAVRYWPWLEEDNVKDEGIPKGGLRVVIECGFDHEGEIRWDVPVSFRPGKRSHGIRKVREEWVKNLPPRSEVKKDVSEQIEVRS